MERRRAISPALLLALAALWASACGDDSEGPELSQDASSALPEAAVPSADDAGGAQGTPGGTQGGGSLDAGGAGARDAGGGTSGPANDAGRPGGGGARDAGQPPAPDAGPIAPAGDGGPDPFAEVRQVCVDTINMYRATMNLQPIARANATLEACSDMGAKYDGDMNKGHASTQVPGKGPNGGVGRLCGSPPLAAQNTCPGWGVGARTGNATLADALKKCLAQMWAEGEPPGGVKACKDAYFRGDTACFLAHGHWINMSEPSAAQVSCGFYDMGGNKFWMNQDFAGAR